VTHITPIVYSDPGLTNASMRYVFIKVRPPPPPTHIPGPRLHDPLTFLYKCEKSV
jgi:hypothetical protein